jgi:hypothetical protein
MNAQKDSIEYSRDDHSLLVDPYIIHGDNNVIQRCRSYPPSHGSFCLEQIGVDSIQVSVDDAVAFVTPCLHHLNSIGPNQSKFVRNQIPLSPVGHEHGLFSFSSSDVEQRGLFFPHLSTTPRKRTNEEITQTIRTEGILPFRGNKQHLVTPHHEIGWAGEVPYRSATSSSYASDIVVLPSNGPHKQRRVSHLTYQLDKHRKIPSEIPFKLKPYQPKRCSSFNSFGVEEEEAESIFNPNPYTDLSVPGLFLANPLNDSDSCSTSSLPEYFTEEVGNSSPIDVGDSIDKMQGTIMQADHRTTSPWVTPVSSDHLSKCPRVRDEDAWLWLESITVDPDANSFIVEAASSKLLRDESSIKPTWTKRF